MPELSVIIPMHNEAGNVVTLLDEVCQAMRGHIDFEIVVVDDASSDSTAHDLLSYAKQCAELRVLQHKRQSGQSTALWTAARAARGDWLLTLDGDGQNDPADVHKLLAQRRAQPDCAMLAGVRVARQDVASKRMASRIANAVRQWYLKDGSPDTGCGIKLIARQRYVELPYFDHMHRYLAALIQAQGGKVMHVPVHHRPRRAGVSHYSNWQRFWVGLADLRGVHWLMRRQRPSSASELTQR